MARKQQKSKGFNKFLDLIGLVNEDNDMDSDFDGDFDPGRGRGRSAKNINVEDEFADEPRMSRVQPRRDRAQAASSAAANDRFDADEGWNTGTAGRPQYGARTQQRAQSSARTSARYGSEQRFGGASSQNARTNSRFEGAQARDNGGFGRAASAYGGYQSSQQRTNANAGGYDAYGSSYYGGYEAENAYGGAKQEQPARGGYQRHQTIIFKLRSVDGCKDVIKALIDKKSVLLNLDELDTLQTQRTIDTMCGATYAIGATLSRASDRTWLITPSTVDVADSQPDTDSSYGGRYI